MKREVSRLIDRGFLLADRYKILDTLGEGGMANVYLAEDIILQRKVAVKVLRMDLQNDPKTVHRFQREALATSELSHPNIVSILDVGTEKGMQYLVMEYVDGPNLKEYIHDHYPLSLNRVLDIMDHILSAVTLAHQHNVIHRDLKPQNILMDPNGNIKIADFGIAVALSQQSITQTNSLLGSVHYMSPEQARGSMATRQSDIYSLGIILYEMITGNVPFGGETAVSIALKHFQENIPSIRKQHPEVPQPLENVVLKATSKDPRDRYETVAEMQDDLDTSLDYERSHEPLFVPLHNAQLEETIILPDMAGEVTETKEEPTNSDNEKTKSKKGKLLASIKKHQFWWIFAAIAALIVIFTLIFALNKNGEVHVPDVTNMTEVEAKAALEKANLEVGDIDRQPSNTVVKGNVIRTIPEKNMAVKSGAEIGMVISSGPGLQKVPDVTGQSYTKAKAQLEKLGFTVTKETVADDAPKNEVLRQSVSEGEKVDPATTTITLTVSAGKEKVKLITLRDLSGYTLKSAQDYLKENGLTLQSTEEFSDTVTKGQIISQNPVSGSQVAPGSMVSVVISKGANNVVTRSYNLTYNEDNDTNGQGNHIVIYLKDDTHSIATVYKDMYIKADSSVNVTLTLNDGAGQIKIVQDGQSVVDESVEQ